MGSGTLLKQIATVSDSMEPAATGYWPGSPDGADEGDTPRNRRTRDHMYRRSQESGALEMNVAETINQARLSFN